MTLHTPRRGYTPLNEGCPASILGWLTASVQCSVCLSIFCTWRLQALSPREHMLTSAGQVPAARHGSLLVKHLMCTWHCISSFLKEDTILSVEDFFFLTSQNSLPSQKPTHINLPLSVIITKKREERTRRKKNYQMCLTNWQNYTQSDHWNMPFFPCLHPTTSL